MLRMVRRPYAGVDVLDLMAQQRRGTVIRVPGEKETLRSRVSYKASPIDLTWGMSSPGEGA